MPKVSFDFTGTSVVITGGASGIGRAISEAFASAGAAVTFSYRSSAKEAEEIEAWAATAEARVTAVEADGTRAEDAARLAERALSDHGKVDVLVANTGGLLSRAVVEESEPQLWQEAFEVNVLSTYLAARAVIPTMRQRGEGSIILMGSAAGHDGGGPGATHYAAAKGAVHTFIRGLAKEVAGHGIRVNGLAPGMIDTQFHDRFTSDEVRHAVAAKTPLGREGTAAEVAQVALFLASPAASYLTGEIVEVNGGLSLY